MLLNGVIACKSDNKFHVWITKKGCCFVGDHPQEITPIESGQLSIETDMVENATVTNRVSTVNTSNMSTAANSAVTLATCKASRYFDGMSFIGGMVFAFGSVAILCFVRLFFQVHREHSYHTL